MERARRMSLARGSPNRGGRDFFRGIRPVLLAALAQWASSKSGRMPSRCTGLEIGTTPPPSIDIG